MVWPASAVEYAFDLEGTLVNLESLHLRSFQHVAERLGVDFDDEGFGRFAGAGDDAISGYIADMANSSKATADSIKSAKQALYRELLLSEHPKARPGVEEYLVAARAVGKELLITSITPQVEADFILRVTSLVDHFAHVLTAEDVSRYKPEPEVYLRAAHILRIDPAHLLVHEDSPVGVKAGNAAGCIVVAFPVHEGLVFDPSPDALFSSWIGLSPHVVASTALRTATCRPHSDGA